MSFENRTSDKVDDVGERVREGGRRPPLPGGVLERLHGPALEAWENAVRHRRRRQRFRWAAAALVFLAAGAGYLWWRRPEAPRRVEEPIATIEASRGQIWTPGDGVALFRQDRIETDDGHLALRLSEGHGVRLDVGTRLRLLASEEIWLEAGAVYVDAAEGPLSVRTAWGTARHVGTRFEVRLDPRSEHPVRLRVREGTVVFESGGERQRAVRGERLLAGDPGIRIEPSPPFGPDWQWVVEASPPFDADGRPLREFLEWIAEENGWILELRGVRLVLEDGSPIMVHGSSRGLAVHDALDLFLSGADLGYQLRDGHLLIVPADG